MPTAPRATVPPSGDPSVLRRLNLQAVLRVLHAGGDHTITELAAATGLSRPTTTQALDDLVASGWAVGSAKQSTSVGRPAQWFRFRPEAECVLGVQIGERQAVALVSDLSGTVLARARRDISPEADPDVRLAALDDVVAEVRDAVPAGTPIVSATLATTGTVDADGYVVYSALPGWLGQNPGARLAAASDLELSVTSDVAMAALAEQRRGAAQGAADVVYLHADRRSGVAALVGGVPHLGHHGAALQAAVWKVTPWRTDYAELLGLREQSPPAATLLAGLERGDADAAAALGTYADEVVAGLLPLVIAFDPELLVIGGVLAAGGATVSDAIQQRLVAETPFAPRVVTGTLGDEAVATGALLDALDRAEGRIFAQVATATAARPAKTP